MKFSDLLCEYAVRPTMRSRFDVRFQLSSTLKLITFSGAPGKSEWLFRVWNENELFRRYPFQIE